MSSTKRGQPSPAPPNAGEPLRASWRPEEDQANGRRRGRKGRRRGIGKVLRTYGWRIYALPVLLVITVLVLADTIGKEAPGANAAANQSDPNAVLAPEAQTSGSEPPEVTEQPVVPVDVNVPTAELPNGGAYTEAGANTWHVVPGSGPQVGTGRLYTYTVEVEDGIDATQFGGDDAFAKLIDQTLIDPRGWTSDGKVAVQRVDSGEPDIRISLSTPETIHKPDRCGYSIKYESSCYRRSEDRVLINLARWVRGAVAFNGDILTYRQYAINHEIGHAFNNGHVGCAEEGALAPVMMQQTFGVANNFVAELNDAARLRDPVQADGKTCKPNAWPNPQAKPPGG